MYRSDKQFMKNPATAAMRIYIGNLSDSVVPENLEERFKQHGHILGMHAQKGFAFIQYETADQARVAINREDGSQFHNRKINVKHANVDKRPGAGGPVESPGIGDQRGNQRGSFGDPMNRPMRPMNEPPPLISGGDSGDFVPPGDSQQRGLGPNRGNMGSNNQPEQGSVKGPNMGRPHDGGGPNQGGPNLNERGPLIGGNMSDRGPMGRNMNEGGPMGGNMNDRGPMGRNMNEGGPMGRNMNEGGPMGRNMNEGGPMGRNMNEGGPMGRNMNEGGPPMGRNISEGGPMGRNMNEGGPMGRNISEGGTMGRNMNEGSPMGGNLMDRGPMGRNMNESGPNMGRGPMNDGGPGGPVGRMGDRDHGGPGNRQSGPGSDRGDRGDRGGSNQRGGDRDDDYDNRNRFGGGGRNRGRGGGRGGQHYNSRDRVSGRDNFRDRGDDNQFDNFGPRGPNKPDNNRGGPPRGGGPMGPMGGVSGGPRSGSLGRDGPMGVNMDSGPGFGVVPLMGAKLPGPPERAERNDCEIIVVSKQLTIYAEYIEQRLKSMGLVVDLLFPNEDVPIGRVLANISSRGCLFAILVMPQNEENRSLTLNILHGIPQEHRNMPLEDSLILITRNFDAYMRGEAPPVTDDDETKKLTDRHPDQIQTVFNLLAENRQLSSGQYDRVIKYLEERKELQLQFELAEGIESELAEPEVKNKRAELQSRIMNILNKTEEVTPTSSSMQIDSVTPSVTATSVTGGSQTNATAGPTPLLNDPSVQKALDSILMGDMFKGLTGAM